MKIVKEKQVKEEEEEGKEKKKLKSPAQCLNNFKYTWVLLSRYIFSRFTFGLV